MKSQPSRRQALKRLAAGIAAPAALTGRAIQSTLGGQAAPAVLGGGSGPALVQVAPAFHPQTFSDAQLHLVSVLADLIIPATDTPGASGAGVDRYIDGRLAASANEKARFLEGLQLAEQDGFTALRPARQLELLTAYSQDHGPKGEFFRLLKAMTIEGYYGSETGMVQELGYKGNTYVKEFAGCNDPEHR